MVSLRRLQLVLVACVIALLTIVCSSGYITPASLTATAEGPAQETALPTAFFVFPTDTATLEPTATETPDPVLASPTPKPELITPTPLPSLTPTDAPIAIDNPPMIYYAKAGETLLTLANRFNVNPFEIVSAEPIPDAGFIDPGQMLMIPQRLGPTTPGEIILPDSEVVYSPSAIDFDAITYVNTIGGHVSRYRQYLGTGGWYNGAELIERVALENSINPRILLSLLQYQSNWVVGQPSSLAATEYPMGYINVEENDLFSQLTWAVNQLSDGYYQWRDGSLTHLEFKDGSTIRIDPNLNAGSVAIQYYFHQLYQDGRWAQAIDPEIGLAATHKTMFGDVLGRAAQVEPLFPPSLEQPPLILPFLRGQIWAYTGGPHGAWEREGSQAALDFAPSSVEHGCAKSDLWTLAAAPGVIARTSKGVIVLDLDGDGNEQTGWAIMYLHVRAMPSIKPGKWVDKGDLLGNPSCEGGISTGTHLHIARKYNGEWIAADGPIPFNLGGWIAHETEGAYQGTLTRDGETIKACTCASYITNIMRTDDDP